MKNSKLYATLSLLLCALLNPFANAGSSIVILRHGEKPAAGLGQLSCQGLNRSLALPRVLLARYGRPTAIYAPNPSIQKKDKGVPYAYIRPLATIEPLAIQLGMPVILNWAMNDVEPLAAALLAAPDGVQLVAWEHHPGMVLAKTLLAKAGGNPLDVPKWADDDFDSLYVIRIDTAADGSKQAVFAHEHQDLNAMPQACPSGSQP